MKQFLLLFILLWTGFCAALSFEAEELQFTLKPGSWQVDGLFYFANFEETTFSGPIFFPVPVDSLSSKPELLTLEIAEDSAGSCKLLSQGSTGFSFLLEVPELHNCTLHLVYSQQLKGNKASYMITSAKAWGNPLEYASYSLWVDPELTLTELPFPLQEKDEDTYRWEFYEFVPEHEFSLSFTGSDSN